MAKVGPRIGFWGNDIGHERSSVNGNGGSKAGASMTISTDEELINRKEVASRPLTLLVHDTEANYDR